MRGRLLIPAFGLVAGDLAVGFARALGFPVRTLGNRARHSSVEAEADYHEAVWAVYRRNLGEKRPSRVCEVGPGDSVGMNVMFATGGAKSITFVDRFVIQPAPGDEEVGEALFRRHAASLVPGHSSLDDVDRITELVHRKPAEDYFAESTGAFDFICSNAVLEHLDDPIAALTLMHAALAPGGVMVHIVDLRGHGLFKKEGPLAWFETPPWLHGMMRRNTARPNRVLFDHYRHWADTHPVTEIFVRHLVGSSRDYNGAPLTDLPAGDLKRACERVDESRANFTASIRGIPSEDLAIAAFLLVMHKEEAASLR